MIYSDFVRPEAVASPQGVVELTLEGCFGGHAECVMNERQCRWGVKQVCFARGHVVQR